MERKIISSFLLLIFTVSTYAQYKHSRVYSTFDNLPLSGMDTFNNGSDGSGRLFHFDRTFNNNYDTAWGGSWFGWSLSNMRDDSTAGFQNQYSSITGSGVSNTSQYLVGYKTCNIKLENPTNLTGAYLSNNTYAYFDMLNGSSFSKKFGGETGDDPDYFRVVVESYLKSSIVAQCTLYLADFRSSDNSEDYILKDWQFVDFNNNFSSEILADSVSFRFESSDLGMWGINTPTYFCMDDFNAKSNLSEEIEFETFPADTFDNGINNEGGFLVNHLFFPNNYNEAWDSWSGWSVSSKYDDTTAGFQNQYSSITPLPITTPESYWNFHQIHFVNSAQKNEIRTPFGLDQDELIFGLVQNPTPVSFFINNTTYAALDMLNGSSFSKKFGGETSNDPDYFRVIASFEKHNGEVIARDTIYLADYRFSDNSKDYILNDWVKLELVPSDKVSFILESSDNGMWGMNTPSYFSLALAQYIPSSINMESDVELSIYPNPVRESLNIISNSNISTVIISSLDGRSQINQNYNVVTNDTRIDVSYLQSGVYVISVDSDAGRVTKKFIKQ